MRISSGMIFDAGVTAINRQTSDLLHLQQQLSTGQRMVTPADDPVAAARALEVKQAEDITNQYTAAQGSSADTLGLMETQLQGASDLLTQVRTLAVQAGNSASLTNSDMLSIGTELRASFDQLLGIANATDSSGQYMFSGYMGNTKPFSGSVASGVAYSGDDGQRRLQVSASRQLEVSESGNAVFNNIKSGNGNFVTGTNSANTGHGVIDTGSVTNLTNWNSASNSGNLQVNFWVDTAGVIGAANTTYYDLVDAGSGNSLFTNAASKTGVGGSYTHAFSPGQTISFSGLAAPYTDFGASVSISGSPANGDSFSIKKSSTQSVFDILSNLISVVEQPKTAGTSNAAAIANALTNIDQASQNIVTVQTRIGSRMNETDSLKSANSSLNLQYQQALSQLQDIDYAKTISDLTRTQTQLQAAQKSFVNVSQLSLFNYIT